MDLDDLRRRLREIRVVEGAQPTAWDEVERLCDQLQADLPIDATPEIVNHYLDEADIRRRDAGYAVRQGEEIDHFIATGELEPFAITL